MLKIWHIKAVGSRSCRLIFRTVYSIQNLVFTQVYFWTYIIKNKKPCLYWLLDLVSVDAKLLATNTINCANIFKSEEDMIYSICHGFTHIYSTIQMVLLVRLPDRSLVTCLFIDCMHKWNCSRPWWNFYLHKSIPFMLYVKTFYTNKVVVWYGV